MVRTPDPFKPPTDAVYTNGEVNRAGQLLRRFYLRPPVKEEEDDYAGFDVDELVDALASAPPGRQSSLKKTWTIVWTKDYLAEPRSSGYRAMHHVVRPNGSR